MTRLPGVQLIGAQKAGTSAIADWLFQGGFHRPRIFDEEPLFYNKEVHFFDIDCRFQEGLEFYARRFECSDNGGQPFLDATPDTLPFAYRVRSIYEAAGQDQVNELKIILILREPVTRELSLYNHLAFDCRNLEEKHLTAWQRQVLKEDGSIMTFDEFTEEVSVPALCRKSGAGRSSRHGLYYHHLRQWFRFFDRQRQILVLSYSELQNDPDRLQTRIEHFLELSIPGKIPRSNCNDSHRKVNSPSEEAKQRLLSMFRKHNQDLYHLLDSNPGPCMEQTPLPRFSC